MQWPHRGGTGRVIIVGSIRGVSARRQWWDPRHEVFVVDDEQVLVATLQASRRSTVYQYIRSSARHRLSLNLKHIVVTQSEHLGKTVFTSKLYKFAVYCAMTSVNSLPSFLKPWNSRLPGQPSSSEPTYVNALFQHKRLTLSSHSLWWPSSTSNTSALLIFIPGEDPPMWPFNLMFLWTVS